jgi:peptide/nickel transport system substrate-binding protein
MRYLTRVIAAAAAIAVATAVTSCAAAEAPAEDTSITIAVPVLGVTYNPFVYGHLYGSYSYANQATYDTLVIRSQTENGYRYDPWVASEYEVSDDRHTLSITLRDDVDFTDGEHLTAQGAVAYFEALFASDTYLWHVPMTEAYQTAFTVTGEYTFEIATAAPIDEEFTSILCITPIASPAVIDTPEVLDEAPVGSGPYVIDEVVADVSMTLTKNPDHWNADAYDFDTIEIVVFDDKIAALNALKSGQIDAAELDLSLVEEAEASGLAIRTGVGAVKAIFFGDRAGKVNPAIADVRVRQAINMAFDREAITESVEKGYGTTNSQFFAAGEPEYLEGEDDFYPYDPERARELLAEAGYPDGFELVFPGTASHTAGFEPLVTQYLGDIGITATFETLPDDEWGPALASGSYAAVAMSVFNDAPSQFLDPDGFYALGWAYQDETMASLRAVVRTGDADEVAEVSQEIGRYVLDEAWFAPFSHPMTMWATDPSVTLEVGSYNPDAVLRGFRLAD